MGEEVDNTLHFKGRLTIATVLHTYTLSRIKVYMICKHFNGLLIGQMMFFAEWNVILYLCSPILNDISSLQSAGLFINDLAMHDFSRDLLLTGTFLVTLNQLLFYIYSHMLTRPYFIFTRKSKD